VSLDFLTAGSQQTLWLAPIVGAYLCLSALGMLRREEAGEFIADLRDRPAALHAVGAVAFFVGAGLLSFHRHWSTPPEIILNLVAAWWLFEGAGMLADPKRMRAVFSRTATAKRVRLTTAIFILPGAYLLLIGFFGNVS
jgi:hypothetical protein